MKKKVVHGVLYTLAFLWCLITILPLAITFMSSFKNNNEILFGLFNFQKFGEYSIMPMQWKLQMR